MKKISLLLCLLSSTALANIDLALNWKAEPEFGGFYQAQADGLYNFNEQKVNILEGGAGTPTIQMVASGKYPFGIVSGDELILSQEKSDSVVALFATFQKSPYAIITHAERNFKTMADVFKSDGTLMVVNGLPFVEFLKKKHAPVKAKMVPYLGGTSLFEKDKKLSQQGFITSEPIFLDKAKVAHKSFLVADEGFNPYTVVLVVNKDYYKKNPELVKQLTQATRKGWENYLKSPQKTNELMSKLNPSMSLEVMNKSTGIQTPLIQPQKTFVIGKMEEVRWQELYHQLRDLGLVKKEMTAKDLFLTF